MSTTIVNVALTHAAMDAKRNMLAEQQVRINDLARGGAPQALVEAAIRSLAAEEHAAYPQYEGRWDRWVLGKIRRRIETKAGLSFEPGDVVLVQPPEQRLAGFLPHDTVTVYSVRVAGDVAVNRRDVGRVS